MFLPLRCQGSLLLQRQQWTGRPSQGGRCTLLQRSLAPWPDASVLKQAPVPLIAQGKGLMEAGALWRRGSGATVMLVRPLDTQLWSLVNEASSWPGHAVCGVSTQGAHGLGAVTEAGIGGLRAVRCRRPGLKAHSSAAAFRGEVILPGTSCLRCWVFLKDYHGI